MMAKSHVSLSVRLTLFLVLCALAALPVMGQVAKQGNDVLSSLAFVHEKLRPTEQVEPLDNVRAFVDRTLQNSWEAYRIGVGPTVEWSATVDRRTGLVSLAEGGGVAWIPGRGNKLTAADIGGLLKTKPQVDLEVMDSIARGYMSRVQSFLGVDPSQLCSTAAAPANPPATSGSWTTTSSVRDCRSRARASSSASTTAT